MVLIDIVTTQSVLPGQSKRKSQTATNPLTRMPDVSGVDFVAKQAVYNEPDDKSKRERFEKRRKVDGCTEHQIL